MENNNSTIFGILCSIISLISGFAVFILAVANYRSVSNLFYIILAICEGPGLKKGVKPLAVTGVVFCIIGIIISFFIRNNEINLLQNSL